MSQHNGRFFGLFRPPAPSGHRPDIFFVLIPASAFFKLSGTLLSRLVWSKGYEHYAFLLDHLALICAFLFRLAVLFTLVSALRLFFEGALRALQRHAASGDESRQDARKQSLERACALAVRVLGVLYALGLAALFLDLALRNIRIYSPLIYAAYYGAERFPYPVSTLLIVAGLGAASAAASRVFQKFKRLKGIGVAPALRLLFQTMCISCLVAAADIALSRFAGVQLTAIAEWLLAATSLYLAAGVLRGAILSFVKGDLTGAFDYPPLISLPERIPLFDRSVSWEERTGLSFKSLWYARYTLRLIPATLLCASVLVLAATSVYTIEPYQEALVYRLGTLANDSIKTAGLHFKLPWPIDIAQVYDVARVRNFQVGYAPTDSRDNLWTSAHGGDEYTLLLGEGNELIAINLRVAYHIADLRDYATLYANPESLLSSKVYELMMRKSVASTLTTMLGVDRASLSDALHRALNDYAREDRLGLEINEVIVESIHPPVEVASVYQKVVSAGIEKEATIRTAEGDTAAKVNGADQEARSLLHRTQAGQITRLALARSDMAVYENAFAAYEASPACYVLRQQTDAYEKIIASLRVYAFSPDTAAQAHRFLLSNGLSPGSLIPYQADAAINQE